MTLSSPQTTASVSETLADILKRAGVGKSSTIRVTGPAGLAALLWFCRHGYDQVGYARGGPHLADDADLVLVPQTRGLSDLERLLHEGPHPRDGGVLIVQTPEPESASGADPVHDLLARSGYRLELCLHGRHRELHVARRDASQARRLAA